MRHLVAASAATVLLLSYSAGCSPAVNNVQVQVATYTPRGTGGDAAALAGTIEVLDDCIHVNSEGELFVPVFPRNEVDTASGAVVYAGATLRVGDQVLFGGSEASLATLRTVGLDLPRGCRDSSRYWLVAQM
jgi:hypothetical protein